MTGESKKSGCCGGPKKAPCDGKEKTAPKKERDVLLLNAYEMSDEEEQGGCCGGSCGCG